MGRLGLERRAVALVSSSTCLWSRLRRARRLAHTDDAVFARSSMRFNADYVAAPLRRLDQRRIATGCRLPILCGTANARLWVPFKGAPPVAPAVPSAIAYAVVR